MNPDEPFELPRKTRKAIEAPFHAHEFTFSTSRKRPVLLHSGVPEIILDSLDQARRKFKFQVNAFVVMPDHVHVLVLPTEEQYSIGPILQAIKGSASRRVFQLAPELREVMRLPKPIDGVGHRLWEPGGGYDRNFVTAKTAWAGIRYIHMNPVRKGLCAEIGEWPWSSARAYEGGATPIPVDLCEWCT